eukprot:gene11323-biopygen7213
MGATRSPYWVTRHNGAATSRYPNRTRGGRWGQCGGGGVRGTGNGGGCDRSRGLWNPGASLSPRVCQQHHRTLFRTLQNHTSIR